LTIHKNFHIAELKQQLGEPMLNWAVTFLIIAIIAGLLGLGGVAGTATYIAYILFVVFLILFLISLIRGGFRS
jgi:uncharacterized membrane protein YtjA (UPF0391 family)